MCLRLGVSFEQIMCSIDAGMSRVNVRKRSFHFQLVFIFIFVSKYNYWEPIYG